jgi:hypothetical protein
MNLKTITAGCLFALMSSGYAATANHHVHPEDTSAQATTPVPSLKAKYAGYCEIEIINQSYDDVRVNGVFDDGKPLDSFSIYSYEAPHYISLYYYGYCHYGMNLYIDSYYGYNLYSAFTTRETTVRIYPVPYLKEGDKAKSKVEVSPR